jgi:hypothetical protein
MSARAEEVSLVVLVNCQLVDSTYKGPLSLRKGEGRVGVASSECAVWRA